jgi:hypothetical protein
MTIESRSHVARIEDIMTPRSMLRTVRASETDRAKAISDDNDFDVVPVSDDDRIVSFWTRRGGRVRNLSSRHLVAHDVSVARVLPRLARHVAQFVSYRDQIVGLVDLSDLNKPLARLVIAHPLLTLEQAVLTAARARGVSDEDAALALGAKVAKSACNLRKKARRGNANGPLLEFAFFGDALCAAVKLDIISADRGDVTRLNDVRVRVFHPGHLLVANQKDGDELIWALKTCEQILATLD